MGIRSIRTLRDGRVQIERGSNQEAETLTNSIRNKIGDKLETNIKIPGKLRLKIHNIPEKICTDNTEDTIIAQIPEMSLEKGGSNSQIYVRDEKTHSQYSNRGQFSNKKETDT